MFTMKDSSSKPYSWIMEGSSVEALTTELAQGGTVRSFVQRYVQSTINATNYGAENDDQVYAEWLESGELDEIIGSIANMEVLEILDLDDLEDLPDDDEGQMSLSFDDNGGLTDGSAYLLEDYTPAQREALIERGAVVCQAITLPWHDEEHNLPQYPSKNVKLDYTIWTSSNQVIVAV